MKKNPVEKAAKAFRKIINAPDVRRVTHTNGFTHILFKDGQEFVCRGPVVDAVLSGETPPEKTTREYRKPSKGEGVGCITIVDGLGKPLRRKRVFVEAYFVHFDEVFFVHKTKEGLRAVSHALSGHLVSRAMPGNIAGVVAAARKTIIEAGEKTVKDICQKEKMRLVEYEALPIDDVVGW